jgi:hypothetical protein
MSAHETHILTVGCVFICDFEFSKKTWVNTYSAYEWCSCTHVLQVSCPCLFLSHL